ncbi:calcium-binding protein [Lentibacter sp.]|uniref:calcium-binding protein n=1 Tax=Lentibacter sp. TaxID=2024994 RepID=UPI003F6B8C5B
MTSVNIDAWTLSSPFGEDEIPTAFSPVQLTLGFEGTNTSVTYTVVETTDGDVEVDLLPSGLESISIDGVEIGPDIDSLYASISQVSWGDGNEAVVFYADDIDTSNDTLESFVFSLSGDALPELTTLQEFLTFFSGVTSSPNIPAGFQAGDVIDLATVPTAEVVPSPPTPEGETTVFNFNALSLSTEAYDEESDEAPDVVSFAPSVFSVELQGDNSTFNYTVEELSGDEAEVNIDADGLQSLSIDGVEIPNMGFDLDAYMTVLTWGEGNQTTILYLDDLDTSNTLEDSIIIEVAGDALPEMTTVADFENFRNTVTDNNANFPAGFQEGDEIDFSSFSSFIEGEGEGEGEGDNTPSDGDDVIVGGAGEDSVLGGDGNDEVRGGAGDDDLRGNAGRDVLYGDEGNDNLKGGKGADMIFGGADADTLKGNKQSDELYGGSGDDTLKGGNGDDLLEGGDGNDNLSGGKKQDTLDGGAGDDILKGGFGADVFIFNGGADVITDFGKGADQLDIDIALGAEGGTTLAEFIAAYGSQVGDDTVFDFGNGNSLTLEDVTLTSLGVSDFIA